MPVRNNIPRFVPEVNYADGFGDQWNLYKRTQLDSYTGVPITQTRTKGNLGDELWGSLHEMQVLEAGCGTGRFTEILLG